jgi:threonine 3-dehydrogenase
MRGDSLSVLLPVLLPHGLTSLLRTATCRKPGNLLMLVFIAHSRILLITVTHLVCLAGKRHLCTAPNCVGVHRDGIFAEFVCLPISNVWRADPKIPLEVLSCFDPLGNAKHTALAFNILGEDVLITGAGPIGLMSIAIAQHAGARNVVITDVIPYRLDLARKMGATRVVDASKENLKDVQKELGMHEGFDIGFEMSGTAAGLRDMIANMCNGGKIALLGIQASETAINWNDVVLKGLLIKGIYGRKMFETWYKMTVMIQSGLDISPIITHQFSYLDYEEAFHTMKSGQSGKIVLDWSAV